MEKTKGRPRKYTEPMKPYTVRLEEQLYESIIARFGSLRKALEHLERLDLKDIRITKE